VQAALEALAVFGIALVELWAAVPAGVAMGLPAPLVWALTLCGALLGVLLVVLAGERVRAWLVARFAHGRAAEGGRLRRVWERYGVVGWGLLAPLVLGAPLAAAVGVALGASRNRLLAWLSAGVLLWTTVLTVAVALGVQAVLRLV
jgi:hypothetical protein